MLIQGDPKLGTDNLDPMHHDVIEGNLSVLKYKLTNSTVKGHKDCKIENIKLDPGNIGLHADMICPSLKMYGTYSINGRLVALPVEGTGEYSIITTVAVHKFANENWKDVSNDTQDPVFEANFKKLIESANKLFKTIPIEDLFKN
ncbi:DUF233 protein [Operophtera brumata]|uniref:DUF233 protein n=1 Tax=Operophtera brumata TaxID=104452 RepID=A0A0L7LG13_OPEBR|nr:DUF233 protein [Operophtera brumata]